MSVSSIVKTCPSSSLEVDWMDEERAVIPSAHLSLVLLVVPSLQVMDRAVETQLRSWIVDIDGWLRRLDRSPQSELPSDQDRPGAATAPHGETGADDRRAVEESCDQVLTDVCPGVGSDSNHALEAKRYHTRKQ